MTMFIVQVTSGEYSNFSLGETLLGEVNPTPILNAYVKTASESRWKTFDGMNASQDPKWDFYYRGVANRTSVSNLKDSIRQGCAEELKRNGFKEVKTTELWLG